MVRWCWIWLTVTNGVASSRWAKVGVSGAHLDPWNWGNTYLAPRSYPPRKPTWQYRKTSNHEWRCTCIDCISYFFKEKSDFGWKKPLGMFAQQRWKVKINRYWRWWLACWVGKFCTATYHRLPEPQKNSDKWCGIWKLLMPLYKRASIPNINRSFRRTIMDQFCAWGLATKFLPMDSSESCDCDCSPFHPWFSEFSAIGKKTYQSTNLWITVTQQNNL